MPYLLRGGDLQIFEVPHEYHAKNPVGFWGEVTSSIDWCERNYAVTHYVAEFNNTWSNIGLIVLGLYGLIQAYREGFERRVLILYMGVITVGLGSAGFHGTLLHFWQQGDETPMVLALLAWIYNLMFLVPEYEAKHKSLEIMIRYGIMSIGAAWTVTHYVFRFVLLFQVSFAIVTIVSMFLLLREILSCASQEAKYIGYLYIGLTVFAFGCWLIDCNFCDYLNSDEVMNPQLHAWWHMISGLACYCGPIFLSYQRAYYLGLKPKIDYTLGGLIPVVRTKLRKDE